MRALALWLFLSLALCGGARADGVVQPDPNGTTVPSGWPSSSDISACTALYSGSNGATGCIGDAWFVGDGLVEGDCGGYRVGPGTCGQIRATGVGGAYPSQRYFYVYSSVWVSGVSCPANATSSGSTCTCDAGFQPNGTSTACVPECTAGDETPVRYWAQPGPGGFDSDGGISACDNGCSSFFTGYTDAGRSVSNGVVQWWGLGSWKKSGGSCTSGAPVPSGDPEIPPDTCGVGQTQGLVNGKTVCVDSSTGTPADSTPTTPKTSEERTKDTTKTDNGDGTTTTTTTETTTKTDSDGRPTTTTKTTTETCDTAGNCETTETTETEGPGAEEGNPDEEDEGSTFCEENPNSLACAELETPTGPDTPTGTRNISDVTPSGGFGADTGTCPALVQTISIGAVDVFGLVCQYMAGIRFAVIGVAWLIAGLIFLGRID